MTRDYTTTDVAAICRVAPATVVQWCERGELQFYRLPSSTHRRVQRAVIERLTDFTKGAKKCLER